MITHIFFTSDTSEVRISVVSEHGEAFIRFNICGARVGTYTIDLSKDEARTFKDALTFLFDRNK